MRKLLLCFLSAVFVLTLFACSSTSDNAAQCVIDSDCGDTSVYYCDIPTATCKTKNGGTTDKDGIAAGGDSDSVSDTKADIDSASQDGYSDGGDNPAQNDTLNTDIDSTNDEDTYKPVLEPVNSLSIKVSIDQLALTWKNPSMAGYINTKVVRNATAFPKDPADGDLIHEGTEEAYTDTAVNPGQSLYYSVFACYGALGCSEPVSIGGTPCYSQMDLVFVMDVSTSMDYILSDLENEIGLVWDFVSQKVETNPVMGLTVFVDDVTLANSGAAYPDMATLKTDFHTWYKHTSTNQQTQSTDGNSDWPENSLDGLALTAKNYKWRDISSTLRIIIVTTDDTFRESPASFTSGVKVQNTYDQMITSLVDGRIRVAAFAAKLGGSSGNVNVQPGFFAPYNGKKSIPEATGGEVFFIDDVKNGTLHIYEAITKFVLDQRCQDYNGQQ